MVKPAVAALQSLIREFFEHAVCLARQQFQTVLEAASKDCAALQLAQSRTVPHSHGPDGPTVTIPELVTEVRPVGLD